MKIDLIQSLVPPSGEDDMTFITIKGSEACHGTTHNLIGQLAMSISFRLA